MNTDNDFVTYENSFWSDKSEKKEKERERSEVRYRKKYKKKR